MFVDWLNQFLGRRGYCPPDRLVVDVEELIPLNTVTDLRASIKIIGRLELDQSLLFWFERVWQIPDGEGSRWARDFWKSKLEGNIKDIVFAWRTPDSLNRYIVQPRLLLYSLHNDGNKQSATQKFLYHTVGSSHEYTREDQPGYSLWVSAILVGSPLEPEYCDENLRSVAERTKHMEMTLKELMDEETAAIDALKTLRAHRSAILHVGIESTYESPSLRVSTRLEGTNLARIIYERRGADTGVVLGYCSESGFAANPYDLQRNGDLVVDHEASGHTIRTVREGQAYFYTFVLRCGERLSGAVRFCVRLPTQEERARVMREQLDIDGLIARLTKANNVSPIPSALDEMVRRKLAELRSDRNMRLAVTVYLATVRDELAKDPDFRRLSPEERERFIREYVQSIDPNNEALMP